MREEVFTVELVVPRCAGLDVAKDEVVACVRVPDGGGGRRQEVRTYPTFTSGLEALAEWLAAEGVTQVVMEATGQLLEADLVGAGGAGLCAHAGRAPATPRSCPAARPTSAMPPGWRSCWSMGCCGAASCRRRRSGNCGTPARYRKRLIQAHTAEAQRVQTALEDAGIKLDSVAADVLGVSGRAMLTALINGERDPGVLAELARGRLRSKLPQLRQALRGRFGDHHALLVRLALAHLGALGGRHRGTRPPRR
jgi:transposase